MDAVELKKRLEARRSALMQTRAAMEPHWKSLREFIQPFRGRFDGENPQQSAPSLKSILSSEALRARRTLAAGMQSGLTSPSRQWFKLTCHDPDLAERQDVVEWCDDVQRRMMTVMAGSSFYHALHGIYDEIAVFGTGAMVIMPDYDSVVKCRALTAGTYCLGRGASESIDSLYRDFSMSAGAMVAEFGEEQCSDAVVQAAERNSDAVFSVRHAIEPDTESGARWPWRSVYWEAAGGADKLLRVSGYPSFPVMAPRWSVVDDDIYGYGPGSAALADVKMLQVLTRDELEATRKMINPPLVADEALRTRGVMAKPGGITYMHAGSGIEPKIRSLYDVRLDLSQLEAVRAEVKHDINSTMYVDLFLMLARDDRPQMTAREIIERHEEKMLALGPVLERLEWELLTPAIDRVFGIMDDARLIPPPPEALSGREVKVEYISILAQAQQMQGTKATEQALAFAGSLAAANPDVMDLIDADEAVRDYVRMTGAPAKILRSEEEVQALRAARRRQMQQQQATVEAQQAAAALNQGAQGAKTLSEVDPGGGALAALTGTDEEGELSC